MPNAEDHVPVMPPPAEGAAEPSSPEFGPRPEDVAVYSNMLSRVDSGERFWPVLIPNNNAQLTGAQIDMRKVGNFASFGPDGQPSEIANLKFVQQRYIAGILGLKVGPTEANAHEGHISATVTLPAPDDIPAAPTMNSNPERTESDYYVAADGSTMSQVRGDAIHAARYIAAHNDHFSQDGSFAEIFAGAQKAAESGVIEIPQTADDVSGLMSLYRQVTRVLGYQVNGFTPENGVYQMKVGEMRKGFDGNRPPAND